MTNLLKKNKITTNLLEVEEKAVAGSRKSNEIGGCSPNYKTIILDKKFIKGYFISLSLLI